LLISEDTNVSPWCGLSLFLSLSLSLSHTHTLRHSLLENILAAYMVANRAHACFIRMVALVGCFFQFCTSMFSSSWASVVAPMMTLPMYSLDFEV
jgi:hypothetical protein